MAPERLDSFRAGEGFAGISEAIDKRFELISMFMKV